MTFYTSLPCPISLSGLSDALFSSPSSFFLNIFDKIKKVILAGPCISDDDLC